MDCKLHVEILAYGGQSELGTYKKLIKWNKFIAWYRFIHIYIYEYTHIYMKLSSNPAFFRKGSRTTRPESNLSPSSEPLFHLIPRRLLTCWFFLPVTRVKLHMALKATLSRAFATVYQRYLTRCALHHLLSTDHSHLHTNLLQSSHQPPPPPPPLALHLPPATINFSVPL